MSTTTKRKLLTNSNPIQTLNVGTTLTILKKLIGDLAETDWFSVAALRPLNPDDLASPFNVLARVPDSTSEWLGQYPADTPLPTLQQIAAEVVAFHRRAAANVEQNRAAPLAVPTVDNSGEVINNPAVLGKTFQIPFYDARTGETTMREYTLRPNLRVESEAEERERLGRELEAAPKVQIVIDRTSDVDENGVEYEAIVWNGFVYKLPMGAHEVPKPIADRWEEFCHGRALLGKEADFRQKNPENYTQQNRAYDSDAKRAGRYEYAARHPDRLNAAERRAFLEGGRR